VRRFKSLRAHVGRAIASGGGLYPAEVYVYPRAAEIGYSGIYHYNAACHELVDLGRSNPDAILCRALNLKEPSSLGEMVAIITVYFWKSYFKYGDFSYRLSAVDAGVAVGRTHRVGEAEFGHAIPHFDFDDVALNELLGVDGREESVYAVLRLGRATRSPVHESNADRQSPSPRNRHSDYGHRSAVFDAMHETVLAQGPAFVYRDIQGNDEASTDSTVHTDVRLQDLFRAVLGRQSIGERFTGEALDARVLTSTLGQAHAALRRLSDVSPDARLPSPNFTALS